jgi:hypothetical protein
VIHTRGPKAARLAREYAPIVPALADLVARSDTPLPPPVKARILGQFVTAQERVRRHHPGIRRRGSRPRRPGSMTSRR